MTADRGPIRVLDFRSVRGTGGGPEKTILLGTAATSRERFDITVCYLRDRRDEVFSIDAWAKQEGIPYVEILERHSLDPGVWPALRALVRSKRIEIVHGHDYKTNLLALLLKWSDGIVPLSTVHGWTGHSFRERRVYYPIEKRLLSRFPRLIAVSEDIRQELIATGSKPERVTTVLNAIDPALFQRDRAREAGMRRELDVPAGAVVLGAVGRLEPQKRFDLLIEVVAEIQRRRPDVYLLIAGDGSLRPALDAQIASLPQPARTRLLGLRKDVAQIHHAFDIFVQSSDYEGTPNAVLEAMALETPIVATDVGGTREIAHHDEHALIVRPGDRAALGAAIDALLADRDRAVRLARAARQRVETVLSFKARVTRVENVYDELMAHTTPTQSWRASQSPTL